MAYDYKQLCNELLSYLYQCNWPDGKRFYALVERARTALAEQEPIEPSDQELNDTYWKAWHEHLDRTNSVLHVVGLRAILARWGKQSTSLQNLPMASNSVKRRQRIKEQSKEAANYLNKQPLWVYALMVFDSTPGSDIAAMGAVLERIADEIEERGEKGLDLTPGETADWLRGEANVAKAAKDYHG